jgi:hypothetical protein
MKLTDLPLEYIRNPKKYIERMNEEIKNFSEYKSGMLVVGDDNGIWIVVDGERKEDVENRGLLSKAAKLIATSEK